MVLTDAALCVVSKMLSSDAAAECGPLLLENDDSCDSPTADCNRVERPYDDSCDSPTADWNSLLTLSGPRDTPCENNASGDKASLASGTADCNTWLGGSQSNACVHGEVHAGCRDNSSNAFAGLLSLASGGSP